MPQYLNYGSTFEVQIQPTGGSWNVVGGLNLGSTGTAFLIPSGAQLQYPSFNATATGTSAIVTVSGNSPITINGSIDAVSVPATKNVMFLNNTGTNYITVGL